MVKKNQDYSDGRFSSPTSAVSTEETRILTEYLSQSNLFNISRHDEGRRKTLMLKKFFKMKRNQQVVVNSSSQDGEICSEGKVSAIGRDFVMLTNLQNRIWIPYRLIDSANIPYGTPTYSNNHQHFLYDNDLQRKLVTQFGKTVSKKDTLVQQFFEETLRTNLDSWQGTWVVVKANQKNYVGKISEITKDQLRLSVFTNLKSIPLDNLDYVSTVRVLQLIKKLLFQMKKSLF